MADTPRAALLNHEINAIGQLRDEFNIPKQTAHFTFPVGPTLNALFILSVDNVNWAGRKLMTHTPESGWQSSSCLTPTMLFGQLVALFYTEQGLTLSFITASTDEKNHAFDKALLAPESELYFPYPLLDEQGQEWVAREDQWSFNKQLAEQLDHDELHFRHYCAAFLKPYIKPGSVLYDPACSTGTFIASLATAFPNARCIGSDQSQSMVDYARTQHILPSLRFEHGTAAAMSCLTHTCDVLFLRFLNAEVVSHADAQALLRCMVKPLKPGATLVIFGHTPVLINVRYWANTLGLTLKTSLAARPGHRELFEFYVLQANP